MKAVVFDIDGTICDASHRAHHIRREPRDWDAWRKGIGQDPPLPDMLELLKTVRSGGLAAVLCTARDETCRDATNEWLTAHNLQCDALYMRRADDDRYSFDVKMELVSCIIADGFEPVLAIDDTPEMVVMWRLNGVRCLLMPSNL